jgi:hypothetical protein
MVWYPYQPHTHLWYYLWPQLALWDIIIGGDVFDIYSLTFSRIFNDRDVRGIMIQVDLDLFQSSSSPIAWDFLDLPHLTSVVSL